MKYKKILLISLILVLLTHFVFAQDFSHEFGVITNYERDMKKYNNDTTAEAVIIYDSGESGFYKFDNGFNLLYKRQIKIKVLKESYINNAEFNIPIYKGNRGVEKIIEIEANTYNIENSQLIKTTLNKEQYYTEAINEYWDQIKFAMPNVQVGSIIEFKYEITSPYKFLLKDWEFQNSIPTIFSEYKVKMIPFYEYQIRLQGASKFDEKNVYLEKGLEKHFYNVAYKDQVHHFIMKDVPTFKDESFISSRKNYIIKLDFQLSKIFPYGGGRIEILSTWEKVIKDMLKRDDFGRYINKSESKFKKIVTENSLLEKNDKDKVNYTINYLKQNYNWNGFYSNYATKPLNLFLKEKTGDIAQINLYLVGALRAVGIEVYPEIISTRKNGKIVRQYPFLDPFNYVLAYAKVDGKWQLLDATDTYCPNDMIPEKCFNDIGLVIKKGEVKWLKIIQNEVSVIQTDIKTKLSDDLDTIIGDFSINSSRYIALKLRKKFTNDPEKLEKHFIIRDMELTDSIHTKNYDDVNKNYNVSFRASLLTERIGNIIIIHPFFNSPLNDNPLKEEKRKYPIDMIYPKSTMYTNEITIPENCRIKQLPEKYFFNSDFFSLQYSVSENNGKINVSSSYLFKKAVYQPENYAKIKRYFNLIIKHLNQKIVLIEE
ncbi:MAG: DUF3857 domain-containing protein [Bacteroidales bacterium]|nr:DUF3857 domain-containing protein [Bacteroidales bacterium]